MRGADDPNSDTVNPIKVPEAPMDQTPSERPWCFGRLGFGATFRVGRRRIGSDVVDSAILKVATTNHAFHFGVHAGVPSRCSFLSVNTHTESLPEPLGSKSGHAGASRCCRSHSDNDLSDCLVGVFRSTYPFRVKQGGRGFEPLRIGANRAVEPQHVVARTAICPHNFESLSE
ncbi:hypothetical protein AK812_SmicGene4769 [Symbiodinium microadriaticum]|uniref:Uncharacterized protein n=1 Tax=Symbiodinium microadriaticum TaxID=2951 RepID=A0A1Q9EVK8_SYMMI|nr:hypothetical protein AK812_SmicGene4769 [Symbiodinium microadriaticum]